MLESITGRTSIYQVIHQEEIRQKIEGLIFENDTNYAIFSGLFQRAKLRKYENKRTSDESVTLTLLDNYAIRQLLTDRYLDESDEFYNFAYTMLIFVSSINQNILTKEVSSALFTRYLQEKRELWESIFDQYRKNLIRAREKAKNLS